MKRYMENIKVKMKIFMIVHFLLLIHSLNSLTKNRSVYSRQILRISFMNQINAKILSRLVEFPDHEEKWDEGEVSWNIANVPKKNNKTISQTTRLDYSEQLAFLFI